MTTDIINTIFEVYTKLNSRIFISVNVGRLIPNSNLVFDLCLYGITISGLYNLIIQKVNAKTKDIYPYSVCLEDIYYVIDDTGLKSKRNHYRNINKDCYDNTCLIGHIKEGTNQTNIMFYL